ncbi:MAG: hypothetical protein BWK74_01175, partial [Desulfobacteraceae bacterium A6]
GRYAAIIYTLDERIYKIEIGFLIAEPSGLSLKRSGENNVISWNSPGTVQKPSGYQVFINDRPFKTVEDPVADVPRTKGKADLYKVKAVYKHGSGVIVSAASDELQDHITLAEINMKQEEKLAAGNYALVAAGLKSGEWEKAKSLLYENRPLFTAHLAKPQQDDAAALAVFFNRIDDGDRLAAEAPETVKSLDKAVEAFGQAPEKAGGLDVGYIRKEKIGLIMARQAALKEQQRKEQQLKDLQLKEQQQKEEQLKEKQLKEQAARVARAEPVMPPERSSAEPLTGQVTPTSGIKQAVIDFKEKKYTSAFNNFMAVYSSQIANIQKGGSGYIKGVLGLPPRYRAEILFLVEYERLREKNSNDAEAIRTGLEEMFGNIEGMQGPWAIITEDKRTLIKNHINDFK